MMDKGAATADIAFLPRQRCTFTPPVPMRRALLLVTACVCAHVASAFYLPGVAPREYADNEPVSSVLDRAVAGSEAWATVCPPRAVQQLF